MEGGSLQPLQSFDGDILEIFDLRGIRGARSTFCSEEVVVGCRQLDTLSVLLLCGPLANANVATIDINGGITFFWSLVPREGARKTKWVRGVRGG